VAIRIRRILVAIRDLHHPPRAELRKAAQIATAAQAAVELFHVVDVPHRVNIGEKTLVAGAQAHVQARIATAQQRLLAFSRLPEFRKLTVTCHANDDYPLHEAIIRRAQKRRADLLIAATRTRSLTGRWLLKNTDWELIRQCPCPLLLVKSQRPYSKPVVLACVDPFHAHSKPADLDERLLAGGEAMARLLKGSLHAFHAYLPLATYAPMPMAATPIGPSIEMEKAHARLQAGELDRMASASGIPVSARHLRVGVIASELCDTAKKARANIVVMGAVSRSTLGRLFVGSTAENVLDELTCDVLVLKPKRFQSKIGAREYRHRFVPGG